ncbi:MAG: hypothetical protein J0I23_00005, partial [Rhizobiales bacterium]|nr:hypothetical protein [Hyphomicrobiales bacterium]
RFVETMPTPRKRIHTPPAEPMITYGAKTAVSVIEKVGIIHAKTRLTKQELHAMAYGFLIEHFEKEGILEPTAAELAIRTLRGEGGSA